MASACHPFPLDRYTPHGYVDNPGHSWRLSRSGVVRAGGGVGLAWHYPSYPGPYGRRWIYEAALEIEIAHDDLYADHHTTRLMRFRAGAATIETFLADEALVAIVEAPPGTALTARARYRRQLGVSGDWDFGLFARQDPDGAGHLAVYAEGAAFALVSDLPPRSHDIPVPDEGWPDRAQPVEKSILHHHVVPASGRLTLALGRGESSDRALAHARAAVLAASTVRDARMADDARFWSHAPRLEGDWPEHWRRGFVYDLETVRAIVRPPAGIYRRRWDGMQVQVPRVVLAETALDMLLLSYADHATARDVVLGTLEDAIAPNVPCTREDGSVNMVEIGGEACGTAPPWCWPFWCVGLIHRRSGDDAWLEAVSARLEAYLDWWLAHRCHDDGAPFYLCGWESGQDASPRFGAAERGGGQIVEVRPVDLVASIAQAARYLAAWRPDGARWRAVAEEYAARTRSMWHGGWFHDHTLGGPTTPRDPMQLAPLMTRTASPEQVAALRAHFGRLPGHGEYAPLEWPPVALTALESALAAGEAGWAAAAAAEICDRVWRLTDAPRHEPGRPLPGVSHEHWAPSGEWHTEGYGWGAATILLFMRYVAGVVDDPESSDLRLEPRLPRELLRPGAHYRILNLPWQGGRLDVSYEVGADGGLTVSSSGKR